MLGAKFYYRMTAHTGEIQHDKRITIGQNLYDKKGFQFTFMNTIYNLEYLFSPSFTRIKRLTW